MKTILTHLRALAFLAIACSPAMANALPAAPAVPEGSIVAASSDCYAVGQRYASEVGGQLARASAETRDGETVCVVVVLMPARDGQRPRREEVVLPLS